MANWVELKVKRVGSYEPTEYDLRLAYSRVFALREAYADTVARVLFDDIIRGQWGGSYYMDGRVVNQSDPELYSVGGAREGITLSTNEIKSEDDVKAAIELMREQVVECQSDSDDEVCIGFWIDGDTCYFDVSNVVRGFKEASRLANHRGELAIYHFATGEEVRADAYTIGSKATDERMNSWARFMKSRSKAH